MYGLIFNNKHSFTDYGLKMSSISRHILPEPKTIYEDLPGVDGEYDFSAANPEGRTKYKPFIDEIKFSFNVNNAATARVKAHQIAEWLACGEANLIYDDEPDRYYMGRVINKMDIENQLIKNKGCTIQFKCQPFGYALETATTEHAVTGEISVTINNPGTYVMPKMTITGTFTTLTLTCGGKTLTYDDSIAGATIVIENYQCIKDGSVNAGNKLSGRFFEFVNGNNTLTISGTGLNCTVKVEIRPRYL